VASAAARDALRRQLAETVEALEGAYRKLTKLNEFTDAAEREVERLGALRDDINAQLDALEGDE
jgi:hypothetical protein